MPSIAWDMLILKIIIYLNFKFSWAFCLLSGKPTLEGQVGSEGKVE